MSGSERQKRLRQRRRHGRRCFTVELDEVAVIEGLRVLHLAGDGEHEQVEEGLARFLRAIFEDGQ